MFLKILPNTLYQESIVKYFKTSQRSRQDELHDN